MDWGVVWVGGVGGGIEKERWGRKREQQKE